MAGQAALQSMRRRGAFGRIVRARAWLRAALPAVLMLAALAWPGRAFADPVQGEATLTQEAGYARLLLRFAEEVPTEVSMAGAIMIVRFARPVDMSVDQLDEAVPAYVGAVRRDPDGAAIRLALSQNVRANQMTAGERVYIDLLPEKWTGPPPPLPAEVVKELSERALAAERLLRAQKKIEAAEKRPPVRVRAALQPTFVRFVFELPEGVSVSSSLNADKYTLSFSAPLTFDLADAKVAAPSNIKSMNQSISGDNSSVELALIGGVDVHSFREERNYIVDIGFDGGKGGMALSPALARPVPPAPVRQQEAAQPPAAPALSAPPATTPAVAPVTPPSPAPAAAAPKADRTDPPRKPDQAATAADLPKSSDAEKARVASQAPPPKIAAAERPAQGIAVERTGSDVRVALPLASDVPAALFWRADTIWLIVADSRPLDPQPIRTAGGTLIAAASNMPLQGGQAIRIKLSRPQLASLSDSPQGLVLTLADQDAPAAQPLAAERNVGDPSRASVSIAMAQPGPLFRFRDPEVGDTLAVVTAPLPARGLLRPQNFVEFSLLESMQGVAVATNSDDVGVDARPDKIVISRPGGLTLSAPVVPAALTGTASVFDTAEWAQNQKANFLSRLDELINAASVAPDDGRLAANLALGKFYLARGFYHEAKGAFDLALAKPRPQEGVQPALMARAVAEILAGGVEQGVKDLNDPAIAGSFDQELWKGLASARQQKWAEAREKFKNVESAIIALPLDLQRIILIEAMQASLEVRDYDGATVRGNDLKTIGAMPEQAMRLQLLRGRLAEALGRDREALATYRAVRASSDRASAAEAALAEIALLQRHDKIAPDAALNELETLSVLWRGDETEVKNLQMLMQLYAANDRYAEALEAAMTATRLRPNAEVSRQMQDEASALFAQLFLTDKGDSLPPVKALGLFYQYRDLTPIGRRGDEMIRRLADRLVAVDLLDQASELLQYQIDHRLEGAARAQVAARLAMIYLMNRKPPRAIAALRSTRIGDLSGEVRQQRLLLESRAQSDVGRYDLALELIANVPGREAIRLRSDIYWAARRWRESAEQIEVLYGQRWRDFQPLTATEKSDVIRAAIGYALANDALGVSRWREKYGPMMTAEADRAAFDIASKPGSSDAAGLERIAKMAATIDTLDGFLHDMRKRFPDAVARTKVPGAQTNADATGALPKIIGKGQASAAR
ncbi:Tetratricopeptide repeat protein OS=Afipia felis OX=1035 GN=NCTC12722_01526 PE=4 SV=1 [Afipia felis]